MQDDSNLFIVDKKVLPEVFHKVVEAKELIESSPSMTVQDAVNAVGISRSAFYKYRDFVYKLNETSRGHTATIAFNLNDTPGLLSNVLDVMAKESINILTINQNIPINGIANVTISAQTNLMKIELVEALEKVKKIKGVMALKILARE